MTLSYLVLSCLILSCLVLSWQCNGQAGKLATQVCWGWLDGWLTEQLMCWLTDCQASYDLNLDALTDDLAQLLQCVHIMVLCIHPDVSLAMYVSYCILSWNELSKWSASQPVSQSAHQLISQPVSQSASQHISWSVSLSDNQPVWIAFFNAGFTSQPTSQQSKVFRMHNP